MINDDLYEDEVMRDVWERKAQVSAEMADWEAYCKRQQEDRLRLEAEGWKFVSPEDCSARQTDTLGVER
ncbi:MAG: hypothetical protein LBT13_05930 [Treponema sp.]|jgi:hypothetical protein|nr:hypothetical protein [Treponema sp.]